MKTIHWTLVAGAAAAASFASFLVQPVKSNAMRAPASYQVEKVVISFKDHGKLVNQFTKQELIERLGSREVALFEFHDQTKVPYGAIGADRVLDLGFDGGKWRQAEYLLFTCLDGYQNPVPASRFSKLAAQFAVSRKDDPSFMVYNEFQHEKVPMGPIALLWEGLDDKPSQLEASSFIPYQVFEVSIVDNKDVFGGIDPPKDSSHLVKRGVDVFKNHCIACHQMRGKGGKKGPELGTLAKTWDEKAIRSQILDPSAVSTMPSLRVVNPDSEGAATAVTAYLKAMAGV